MLKYTVSAAFSTGFIIIFFFSAFTSSSYAFAYKFHTYSHTHAPFSNFIFAYFALTPNTVASRQATAALTTDRQTMAIVFVGVQLPTWQKLARICQLHIIQYLNYYSGVCVCVHMCALLRLCIRTTRCWHTNKLIN